MVWIDITRPIDRMLPVFPGDELPRAEPVVASGARMTRLSLLTHTGTHVDLPEHVVRGGPGMDEREILRRLIGPARVVRIPPGGEPVIDRSLLRRALGGRPPARVLLCTRPASDDWRGLDAEAATWLAGRCLLVGTDAVSIDPPGPGLDAHRCLLSHRTLILENLRLESVKPGPYHLIALPLRVEASDGAPVRALLRGRVRTTGVRGGKGI